MSQAIVQIDSFTNVPFQGNPAGVCLLGGPADETWMQNVAREMNLAETAFLYPQGDQYHLRWFTPACEVELCGHATLASAHLLFQDRHLQPDQIARFFTLSGELTARLRDGWIELDFPLRSMRETGAHPELSEALGAEATFVAADEHDCLAELASDDEVRKLSPDFGRLAGLPHRGFIVTAKSSVPEYDFVSRFFAPALGIPEDPVTGAAHCALGPYWQGKTGKDHFVAYQASARGGVVKVAVSDNRVKLTGQAVTVLRGHLVDDNS
jgi:PhzF family phenazine biosynthesis protein